MVTNRLVKYVAPSVSTFKMRTTKKEETESEGPKIQREKPPLYQLEFFIFGKTKKSKDELKSIIRELGGKVASKIHENLAAVISSKEEVEKMSSRMLKIQELQIQVVPEDYLEDAKNGGAIAFISSRSICDWGSDVSILIKNVTEEPRKLRIKIILYCSHILESHKNRRGNQNPPAFTLNLYRNQ